MKLKEINAKLMQLELARDAIKKHHNLNLAEVYCKYYLEKPLDLRSKRNIAKALGKRDNEFLEAMLDAEIERLTMHKIEFLRTHIVKISRPVKKIKN